MVLKCVLNCFIILIAASNLWAGNSAEIVKNGNASYRQGQYEEAVKFYQNALKEGGQDDVARYNLGNAYFRQGKARAQTNLDGAIDDLEKSLSSYIDVINKNGKDADAVFNRDIVSRELEKLKKKRKQQQDQQQKQQQKKDKEQDQQKEQNKDQNKDQKDKDKSGKEDQRDQGQKNDQGQGQQEQSNKSGGEQKNGDKDKQQEKHDASPDQKDQQTKKSLDNKNSGTENKGDGALDPQEAKDILEDYQRNEEPQGLLNFIERTKGEEKPVGKDW